MDVKLAKNTEKKTEIKKLKSEDRCINITEMGERCKLKKSSGKDLCHVHVEKSGKGALKSGK